MDHDFDIFVKQHLEDIFCQAVKERALAQMREVRKHTHRYTSLKLHRHIQSPIAQLQDCAISPTFSHNHL